MISIGAPISRGQINDPGMRVGWLVDVGNLHEDDAREIGAKEKKSRVE